jgi:hypothetical protein
LPTKYLSDLASYPDPTLLQEKIVKVRIGLGFSRVCGSGSRQIKIVFPKKKKGSNFMFEEFLVWLELEAYPGA